MRILEVYAADRFYFINVKMKTRIHFLFTESSIAEQCKESLNEMAPFAEILEIGCRLTRGKISSFSFFSAQKRHYPWMFGGFSWPSGAFEKIFTAEYNVNDKDMFK